MAVLIYTKPTVRPAWGDTSIPTTDIVDPGQNYVSAGWKQSSTPPPRQYFNWELQYVSAGIRYLCQNGIPDWDPLESYQIGSFVFYGGFLYQCYTANIGQTPPASTYPGNSYWAFPANVTPVNYLQQYFAQLASPVFSGVPQGTTALAGNNTNQLATTAFVTGAVAPKAPIANPTFTGVPAAPTAAFGTNTTQLATTAFVEAAVALGGLLGSPGYVNFPNAAFNIAWGQVAATGSSPQYTAFASGAFATVCYAVVMTPIASGGPETFGVYSVTKAGFYTTSSQGTAAYYLAVGQ